MITPDSLRKTGDFIANATGKANAGWVYEAADALERLQAELESARAQVTIANNSNGFVLLERARAEKAEAERDRLAKINFGLCNDFNTLLTSESKMQARAEAAEARLADAVEVLKNGNAAVAERARCIAAILNHPGFTEDEKRIAAEVIGNVVGHVGTEG